VNFAEVLKIRNSEHEGRRRTESNRGKSGLRGLGKLASKVMKGVINRGSFPYVTNSRRDST
jgi:hypothetical protein